jgi:hypothetical protein
MRKFAVLGGSALILALGVAQASAVPSTGQAWADYVARTSAQPAQSTTVDFGAQAHAQASAVPCTGQAWADYVARTSAKPAPAFTGGFGAFRAQATDEPLSAVYHHSGR